MNNLLYNRCILVFSKSYFPKLFLRFLYVEAIDAVDSSKLDQDTFIKLGGLQTLIVADFCMIS